MSINYEQNNNHVSSAYGSIQNSKQVNNSSIITPKNRDTVRVYKKTNVEANKEKTAKKKAQTLSNIIKTFALTMSAVIMGVVGISVITPASIVAEELELSVYETGVIYYVSLSELADDVKIFVYNDFTNRVETVTEQSMEGSFENLKENMRYTFEIKQGTKTVAKKSFVTKAHVEEDWPYEFEDDKPEYEDITDDKDKPNGPTSDDTYDDDYDDYDDTYDDGDNGDNSGSDYPTNGTNG